MNNFNASSCKNGCQRKPIVGYNLHFDNIKVPKKIKKYIDAGAASAAAMLFFIETTDLLQIWFGKIYLAVTRDLCI